MKIYPFPEFVVKLLAVIALFFAPIAHIMWSVGILIIFDCITGIWASKKRGIEFSSSRFFSSVTKLVVYLILVMISHLVETNLVPEIPLLKLSVFFITTTEFFSFIENVSIISGRNVIGFFREQLGKLKPFSDKKEK